MVAIPWQTLEKLFAASKAWGLVGPFFWTAALGSGFQAHSQTLPILSFNCTGYENRLPDKILKMGRGKGMIASRRTKYLFLAGGGEIR